MLFYLPDVDEETLFERQEKTAELAEVQDSETIEVKKSSENLQQGPMSPTRTVSTLEDLSPKCESTPKKVVPSKNRVLCRTATTPSPRFEKSPIKESLIFDEEKLL